MNGWIQAVQEMVQLWALVNTETSLGILLKDQDIHDEMTYCKFLKTTLFHGAGYGKAMSVLTCV
jgi:hypothetical protein